MKSPLETGPWLELLAVESTQTVAADLLLRAHDLEPVPGVVSASSQTAGKGRFGRPWSSPDGECIAMSLVFTAYAEHPKPWLIGMAVAIAAAGAVHCQLRWPNDLILDGRKLGGILTEMLPGRDGRRVPVVGVGINVGQTAFSGELAEIATSLALRRPGSHEPGPIAKRILARIADLPEPDSWHALEPAWDLFDDTRGKLYKLSDGQVATALSVGPDGELLCAVDGESVTVVAADALFGPAR